MKLPSFLTEDKYGEIRIAGHRIGLYSIVRDYQAGRTAEEIGDNYPTLSVGSIDQVLQFYLANQAEIDHYIETCRAEIEKQAAGPTGPGIHKLRENLAQLRERLANNGSAMHGTTPVVDLLRQFDSEKSAGTH
jgi:uncharacterized protein (DUF433 family)